MGAHALVESAPDRADRRVQDLGTAEHLDHRATADPGASGQPELAVQDLLDREGVVARGRLHHLARLLEDGGEAGPARRLLEQPGEAVAVEPDEVGVVEGELEVAADGHRAGSAMVASRQFSP